MISLLVSSRRCLQVHHLEIEGPYYYHLQRWDGETYKPRSLFPYPWSDTENDIDHPSLGGMDDEDEDDMGSPPPRRVDDIRHPSPRGIDDIRHPSPRGIDDDDEESPPAFRTIEDDLEFPELRTLRVKSRGYVRFVLKISQTSKLVTSIDYVLASPDRAHQIPNPPFPDIVQESRIGLEHFAQCSSLVSLSLNGQLFDGLDRERRDQLKQVLDNALSLATLELTSLTLLELFEMTPLRLPNLQHLVMKKDSRLWPLIAPLLNTVSLSDDSYLAKGSSASNANANDSPLLTSFKVDKSTGTYHGTQWSGHIEFPAGGLHTLDLCFGTRTPGVDELAKRKVEFNPVVFRLRRTVIPTQLLTQIIDSMERLEELELEEVGIKRGFFEYLASAKPSPDGSISSPSDEVTVNCPRLVRLRVRLKGRGHAQNKMLKAAARKAVKARVKAGVPIEMWLIRSS
jgi:hypothetical protein